MLRYLVRFANSKNFVPKDTMQILITCRRIVEKYHCVVKNLRVTDLAIELDLFVSEPSTKNDAIEALLSKLGRLLNQRGLNEATSPEPTMFQSKEAIVRTAIELFNDQRYWECHETLEQIWRRETSGDEKELQQGIILAASALVHAQKNESDVCLGMIPRAVSKLERWKEKRYYDLDVEKLKKSLLEINENRRIFYPKI